MNELGWSEVEFCYALLLVKTCIFINVAVYLFEFFC